MLDTRNADIFAQAYIPNSINIGLDGNFAQWVGEMIPDVKQQILLITEPGKEEESVTRLSRVGYDHTIGYLKDGFKAWSQSDKDIESITRITAQDLAQQYNNKPLVFDVRKASEYNSEHVVDAINVPLNEINQHLAQFPKETPFILHCAGGYRSMIAASILLANGISNFSNIPGGYDKIKNYNS